MNPRKILVFVLALTLTLALAMPAAAAKKKKSKKSKKAKKTEQTDPWAGRWSLSVSGGGVSSGAGFGFEGRLGVTYYFNKYFSTTLAPGFGTYPVEYDGPDNNTETTYIKYVPTDLSLILHIPGLFSGFTPYFGPGIGYTYYWWTQKEDDPDNPGDTIEEDYDEALWSAFVQAGVSMSMGGPFVVSAGATYTIPDVSEFDTKDGVLSFGFSGGVVF